MIKALGDPKIEVPQSSPPEPTGSVSRDSDDLTSYSGPSFARFAKAQIVLTGGGVSPDEELLTLRKVSLALQESLGSPEKETRKPEEILYVTWASRSDREVALREFDDDIQRAGLGKDLTINIAPSYEAMLGAEITRNWKGDIFDKLSEWEKEKVRAYDRLLGDLKLGEGISGPLEQGVREGIDFRAQFLKQLETTGILYGSSGNQERMIELASICGVQDKIVQKILDGELLYAGTSAGAAVAPGMMITPNGLKPGLGILPEHIAIEQHIDAEGRNRVLRLMDAMWENPAFTVGIGIYEGTSVHIHGPVLTVIGGNQVMYVRKLEDELSCKKLSAGDSVILYDDGTS